MFEAEKYRDQAALAHSKADAAPTGEERSAHRHRARGLDTMADNERWLAENFDKTVHHPGGGPTDLAAEERHIIQCLGAAVIMHWNTLPTKLQRELFDTAGAMGDLMSTPELRGQIARFLHKHKDGDEAGEAPDAEPGPTAEVKELYRSANGDRWLLEREAASARLFVRHEPNEASGGRPSRIEADAFLRQGGHGPEKQALLRLLATATPLAPG